MANSVSCQHDELVDFIMITHEHEMLTVLGLSKAVLSQCELAWKGLRTSYTAKIMYSKEERVTVPAILVSNGHLRTLSQKRYNNLS